MAIILWRHAYLTPSNGHLSQVVSLVAHPILLVSHGVFAFTRLVAVGSALALALILRHLIPRFELGDRTTLVCLGKTPS